MEIEFDKSKDQANIEKHGVSLSSAADFAILAVLEDDRFDYGETRYRAWGTIEDVYYCLVFTVRDEKLRAISLRKAHKKEIKRYVS